MNHILLLDIVVDVGTDSSGTALLINLLPDHVVPADLLVCQLQLTNFVFGKLIQFLALTQILVFIIALARYLDVLLE